MRVTQSEKAARFSALHDGPDVFVLPNPWDIGCARILAELGFQALAISSVASASSLGRRDHGLGRDEARRFPFILTAREHNFIYGEASLADTVNRLQAFEKAGADVLFAPGLPSLAPLATVCAAVSKPFNSWWESRENHSPCGNSPQLESGASASLPHSIAQR